MPRSDALHGQVCLVTRPAHQNQGQIAQLSALGAEALTLPLISIEPVSDQSEFGLILKEAILNLDRYQAVIFVSPNAARLGADWIDRYWPQLPIGVEWIGIGEQTTQALQAAGFPAWHAAGYDSEALLADARTQAVAGQRILILRGNGGRELLSETLTERGAQVDRCCVYQRLCPEYPQALIESTIYHPFLSAILITSGEGLKNLMYLAQRVKHASIDTLLSRLILVPSRRLYDQARSLGFTQIRVASGADDRSMIAALLPANDLEEQA
ncbi:uroporphyrinogen-III synthase [Nitrincola tapanii]|nr:uroporphyrinogen-III synthase [Nitrincola tapanii]